MDQDLLILKQQDLWSQFLLVFQHIPLKPAHWTLVFSSDLPCKCFFYFKASLDGVSSMDQCGAELNLQPFQCISYVYDQSLHFLLLTHFIFVTIFIWSAIVVPLRYSHYANYVFIM